MMNREDVYKAIDSERDYQDKVWGTSTNPEVASFHPAQFLIDIEIHLQKAKQSSYNMDNKSVMNELRKIAALSVKAGELNGMNIR